MIESVIRWSVINRVMVLLCAVMLSIAGVWAVKQTPVDAIPDLSDVQVIVKVSYPGQSPQVVEDQVTFPLTSALMSVPGQLLYVVIRSSVMLIFTSSLMMTPTCTGREVACSNTLVRPPRLCLKALLHNLVLTLLGLVGSISTPFKMKPVPKLHLI